MLRHTAAVLTALAALTAGPALAQDAPRKGGTLSFGHTFKVIGFDPFVARTTNNDTRALASLIFEHDFHLDAKGQPVPHLATAYTVSADGTRWQIKLRKGVKFSNGEAYNAQAVAAHFSRLLDPAKRKVLGAFVGDLAEVVALDDETVEFRLKYASPSFRALIINRYPNAVDHFINWRMAPAHAEAAGDKLNQLPVGTGPYMISEWRADDSIVLVKNPHYWRPERQHLERIVFKWLPDNTARLNALKNADIDIMTTEVERQAVDARKDGRLQVVSETETGAQLVLFNTQAAPLDDARVRRALAHAVDRSVDAKARYEGLRKMATDPYGERSPWYCGANSGYPEYAPEKAKALLADYGKPVKLTLHAQPTSAALLSAQLYQSMWQKVGVTVEIRQVQQGPALLQAVAKGGFQAVLWQIPAIGEPDDQLYNNWHSSARNVARLKNETIDAALDRGRRELDPGKRKSAYCDFAREWNQVLPGLLRGHNLFNWIAQPHVRGVPREQPSGQLRLAEAWLAK
jgi:ABC-type transport system substrate-binding protein